MKQIPREAASKSSSMYRIDNPSPCRRFRENILPSAADLACNILSRNQGGQSVPPCILDTAAVDANARAGAGAWAARGARAGKPVQGRFAGEPLQAACGPARPRAHRPARGIPPAWNHRPHLFLSLSFSLSFLSRALTLSLSLSLSLSRSLALYLSGPLSFKAGSLLLAGGERLPREAIPAQGRTPARAGPARTSGLRSSRLQERQESKRTLKARGADRGPTQAESCPAHRPGRARLRVAPAPAAPTPWTRMRGGLPGTGRARLPAGPGRGRAAIPMPR